MHLATRYDHPRTKPPMSELAMPDISEKQSCLNQILRDAGSLIVAYSGGIDSAYLAYAAHDVLGEKMVAIIADSASLARSHYRDALDFASDHGIPLQTVKTEELDREAYAVNDSGRCFHCKDELFTVLEVERARLGFAAVAYGLNLDDKKDFRPGQRAAAEHRVTAPLAEAGLDKSGVRALAKSAGLTIWDKPASACLSSRIEYGRRVTPEALRMVEDAEESLRRLGLRSFRVRHHGAVARVEIAQDEFPRTLDAALLRRISSAVHAAGFQYAALDLDGYRSGSMNEVLPVEMLMKKARA
jgi:uncharacterized protein